MKKLKPKERVMEIASKLFREQGFNSTGINQIIKESNVAKASFYDHFKSKDSLATEYLKRRHILWFEGLQNYISESTTVNEKILKSFEYLKFMNLQEDFSGCVFINMLSEVKYTDKESYAIIKNHKKDLQNFFKNIIVDESKAFLIYMLFESCITESQIFRTQEIIDNTINHLKKDIL